MWLRQLKHWHFLMKFILFHWNIIQHSKILCSWVLLQQQKWEYSIVKQDLDWVAFTQDPIRNLSAMEIGIEQNVSFRIISRWKVNRFTKDFRCNFFFSISSSFTLFPFPYKMRDNCIQIVQSACRRS